MSSWSFKGAAFLRMDPDGQARAWPERLNITVDVVAGASPSSTPRRYVDIGAREHEAWSFRVGCRTEAERDALVALRYSSGTLVAIGGASYQALLVKAVPLAHDGSGLFEADVEFVFLS